MAWMRPRLRPPTRCVSNPLSAWDSRWIRRRSCTCFSRLRTNSAGVRQTLGQKIRFVAMNVRDELGNEKSVHGNNRFKEKRQFRRNLEEKSHAYLEMDVHSRTAGLGERCRAAAGGVTTLGAT